MEQQYDIIIVGSGPAGMTAAVYATRANMKTLILEKSAPGGKMIKTHLVENYPAYTSITGVDLSMKMHEHSIAFGAEYGYGDVCKIEKKDELFEVITSDGNVYTSKVVIAATGTIERKLGLDKEDELVGKGVSYCAVCDGAFFKDKNVVVVGGGNSALDETLYMTQFVKKATILMRRDVFRADPLTVDKIKAHDKVEIIYNVNPTEIITGEDGLVSGIKIKNNKDGSEQILETSAIFPYIGADAATSYLQALNVLDDKGYAVVNENMKTEIDGLYCVGDMNSKTLRQIVTATNDGAIAAQDAIAYITH